MESILHQLYSGDYDITPERDKTQQKIRDELFVQLDQIQAVLGTEFLERLLELDGALDHSRNFQYYRSGFQLGARLTLEALGH